MKGNIFEPVHNNLNGVHIESGATEKMHILFSQIYKLESSVSKQKEKETPASCNYDSRTAFFSSPVPVNWRRNVI
jgi:hypothetical protein